MKSIIHKAIYWALPLLTLPTTGLLLQSCEEDKAEKWVDLRYRVLLRDPSLQPGAFLFRSQVY